VFDAELVPHVAPSTNAFAVVVSHTNVAGTDPGHNAVSVVVAADE
jgi:hypothetical protein